ncbi:unnamed protein product [Trichobilharzia szidati]|nr:unnamed protein product [Trichobilharzia szidati]
MATAVAVRQNIGNWSKVFPNELGTELRSLVFIKKLLAVAASYVLYFRDIFPESAFHDKQLEGIELKILKESSEFPESSKIIYWLKGCFDAIDRKFLKSATIALYTPSDKDDECNVIESYCFRLSYGQSNFSLSVTSENESLCDLSYTSDKEIKSATLNLLKNIETAGKRLSKLPSELMITMKLQYYDEVTPEDYMTPGFKRADDTTFVYEEDNINVRLGNVRTAHHSIKMHVQTSRRLFSGSVKSTESTQEECVHEISSGSQIKSKLSEEEELSLSFQQQTLASDESESQIYKVRCPCGVNKDDGVMILCDGCGRWQHAICFRISEEYNVPVSHVCEICAKHKPELLQNGGTTDETIQNMTEDARKATCLFRRAISLCMYVDSVSPAVLARALAVEYTVARGIFNRLVKEQVVKRPGPKRGEKLVEKEFLKNTVYPCVFGRGSQNEKKETMKRTHESMIQSTIEKENDDDDDDELMNNCTQDSLFSPAVDKKRRKIDLANTPINIFRP